MRYAKSSLISRTYIPVKRVEILTTSQTWTIPPGVKSFDALVIGGGGAGGMGTGAGGGGAGGFIDWTTFTVANAAATATITVGAAGGRVTSDSTKGGNGGN